MVIKTPARLNRKQQAEVNQQRLLDAALEVFSARGFHGATLEQIAAVAGFTTGVVYSRFASKADLFLALLAQVAQVMDNASSLLTRLATLTGATRRARQAAARERWSRDELDAYRIMASSGTTGRRGVYVWSERDWLDLLGIMRRTSQAMGIGPRLPRTKVALVGAPTPST